MFERKLAELCAHKMGNLKEKMFSIIPSLLCLPGDGEQDPQHAERDLLQQNQRHCEWPAVSNTTGEPCQAGSVEERPGGSVVTTTTSPVKLCVCLIVRVRHSGIIPPATELCCYNPTVYACGLRVIGSRGRVTFPLNKNGRDYMKQSNHLVEIVMYKKKRDPPKFICLR